MVNSNLIHQNLKINFTLVFIFFTRLAKMKRHLKLSEVYNSKSHGLNFMLSSKDDFCCTTWWAMSQSLRWFTIELFWILFSCQNILPTGCCMTSEVISSFFVLSSPLVFVLGVKNVIQSLHMNLTVKQCAQSFLSFFSLQLSFFLASVSRKFFEFFETIYMRGLKNACDNILYSCP